MRKYVTLIFLMLLTACSVDTSRILSTEDRLAVEVYGEGKPLAAYTLSKSDSQYKALESLLAANHDGWSRSWASYVNGIKVKGESFTLNFLNSSMILNVPNGQYVKEIKASDYQFLLK